VDKLWFLWILLFSQVALGQNALRPQPYGQLGEVEPTYLVNRDMYLQLFNNDFAGNTDKYLTNTMGLSYTYDAKWELGLYRRLTTPALSYDFGGEKLASPYGVLADDTSVRLATFIELYPKVILYPEFSINFIGNQNAKEVYNFVHNVVGSPLNYHLYGRERKTIGVSPGLKLVYEDQNYFVGTGAFSSLYMQEVYLLTGVKHETKSVAFSVQYKLVQQLGSVFYGSDIKPYRTEGQVGFRLNWYLFYIHYTSTFLKSDPINQLHISPLNFQWNW
jgi:hypothetical protein